MMSDANCVFCQIVAGKIPCHKVYEDEQYIAFVDIRPSAPGHTLIVTKTHSQDIRSASMEDRKGVLELVVKLAPAILKAVNAQGFNVSINIGKDAGQMIFHTHIHIVPRQPKDSMNWIGKETHLDDLSLIAQKIRQNL